MIADITADQFGHGDVVFEPSDDPRYRSNVRMDLPNYGLTQAEMAFGHGFEWCYLRDWAPETMAP